MAKKLYAGPVDGTYISRRTDNAYSHAVAVIETAPTVYKPRDPNAVNGYVPNPELGKWVSFSWHGRYDLAVKSREKAAGFGYRAVIVPVIDGTPPKDEARCPKCGMLRHAPDRFCSAS